MFVKLLAGGWKLTSISGGNNWMVLSFEKLHAYMLAVHQALGKSFWRDRYHAEKVQ
jgi:hypothetical protein